MYIGNYLDHDAFKNELDQYHDVIEIYRLGCLVSMYRVPVGLRPDTLEVSLKLHFDLKILPTWERDPADLYRAIKPIKPPIVKVKKTAAKMEEVEPCWNPYRRSKHV